MKFLMLGNVKSIPSINIYENFGYGLYFEGLIHKYIHTYDHELFT